MNKVTKSIIVVSATALLGSGLIATTNGVDVVWEKISSAVVLHEKQVNLETSITTSLDPEITTRLIATDAANAMQAAEEGNVEYFKYAEERRKENLNDPVYLKNLGMQSSDTEIVKLAEETEKAINDSNKTTASEAGEAGLVALAGIGSVGAGIVLLKNFAEDLLGGGKSKGRSPKGRSPKGRNSIIERIFGRRRKKEEDAEITSGDDLDNKPEPEFEGDEITFGGDPDNESDGKGMEV